jgi:hypothetical protein
VGFAGVGVLPERPVVGVVGVARLAGVMAQGLSELLGDGVVAGEPGQAARELWVVRLRQQDEGNPAGGDVADRTAAALGGGDAVADELRVQGHVAPRLVLAGDLVARPRPSRGGRSPVTVTHRTPRSTIPTRPDDGGATSPARHVGGPAIVIVSLPVFMQVRELIVANFVVGATGFEPVATRL